MGLGLLGSQKISIVGDGCTVPERLSVCDLGIFLDLQLLLKEQVVVMARGSVCSYGCVPVALFSGPTCPLRGPMLQISPVWSTVMHCTEGLSRSYN